MLRQQVRGWGALTVAVVTGATWTGLVVQGRAGCSTSPAVIGTLCCGLLGAAVAASWATRVRDVPPLLAGPVEDSSAEPLNQSELRETFVRLVSAIETRTVRAGRPAVLAGVAAALLLVSTVLPWRELIDPVATGPTGAEAGVIRSQLWELPYAAGWAVLVVAAAVTTLAAAVATPALRSADRVLRPAAVATGTLVVVGILAAPVHLPPRLGDGVGYRVGVGVWVALGLGAFLLVLGLVTSLRRTPWELAIVVVAGTAGIAAGLFAPAPAGPQYEPDVVAGVPYRLFDLEGGQLEDRYGMRVAVGTADPLDSLAETLDGTPGQWLLGRTGSEGSTLFEYRDGVALPRVSLSHGTTPPALIGVTDNRMLLLAGGSSGRPWALLSVPLDLVAADLTLTHKNPDGSYYVTPGVNVLASGTGAALLQRNADRSIALRDGTTTWQIPANQLRVGMRLTDFVVDPGPGAPGNEVSTGPDGTTAWRTSRTGLAVLRPGGRTRQLTGIAPAGCALSSDVASSSMSVEAFAVDLRGNLWLGGSFPTSVVTPDGVQRVVPGNTAAVETIEARPDGSVVLGSSPGGGDQVIRVDDAAAAAPSYPAAPVPTARCDRRTPANGTTAYRATVMDAARVDPPVNAEGRPGKAVSGASTQLALDPRGRVARVRMPSAAQAWAPDGLGGVWWTVPSAARPVAVHLQRSTAAVVRDPQQASVGQRGESAAASGDRLVTGIGSATYNLYGPGQQVRRLPVTGELRQDSLVQLPSGAIAMVLGERLVEVSPDGRSTALLGGVSTGWPLSTTKVPVTQRTADGLWFTGPDGRAWGYDGSHLVRVDGPGRVTVVAGPAQGVPQAADQVTVIGDDLYFELGNDVVRLEPVR
ncbi:hypothetical protein [Kribbella amoyensis]|uniref:hypothetical protein n=1 Tax=Kribbella amoyensis TaxID=996641 RepID=UPI0011A88561|nr:hypothetical protein [Kribbella amoyensis]